MVETSPGSGLADSSTTVGPARVIGTSIVCSAPTGTLSTRGGSPSRRMVRLADAGGVRHAEILDGDAQRDGLADDAVAGRLDHAQPAVGFLALRRDQHVQRRAAGRGLRDVVHLPVGDGDRAGEAGARNVGQRPVDGGEQPGAGIAAFRHGDGAQLQVRQLRRLLARSAARAASARRARSPTCIEAVWSTTSRPISGRLSRVSCTSRGPASHSSSTAKPARRQQRAARRAARAASATTSSDEHAERGDQPERQQRIEAERGDDLFRAASIAPAAAGSPARAPGRLCSCRSARTSPG